MTMQPNEITVTWWCCQCNRSGRVTFFNQNTIGERLGAAKSEHKATSPGCDLDWDKVFVRNEIEEQ